MFIDVLIKRFWNPIRKDPLNAFSDIIDEALISKRIMELRKTIDNYNPVNDFNKYKKLKDKFWKDEKFREDFLDKIKQKRDVANIRRDFIFMSYLAPESLYKSFRGKINLIGEPLSFVKSLIEAKK